MSRSQTHTQWRGSGYYYRQKVPVDLRPHFGTGEIIRSLKTTKLREASALLYERMRMGIQFQRSTHRA